MLKIRIFLILLLISPFFFNGCNTKQNDKQKNYSGLISEIEKSLSDGSPALPQIDSLQKIALTLNDTLLLRRSFAFRGYYLYSKKNYPEARLSFSQAIKISKPDIEDTLLADMYDNLGRSYNRMKHRDSALYYLRRGLVTWERVQDSMKLGRGYNNIGMAFWDGNIYDSAIVYFEKSLAIREKLSDLENLAYTLNNIGTVYYQWSAYDQALQYYIRSLDVRKNLKIKELVPLVLVNIGLVYKETGNPDKAKEYFADALKEAMVSDDTMAVAYSYYAKALIHQDTNFDSTRYYYEKSLALYKKINHSGGILICLKGLGEIYLGKNDMRHARDVFTEMLAISIDENLPLRIAESNRFLGLIEKSSGNETKAREYFLKSIELSRRINVETFLRESYLNLSEVEEFLGHKEAALSALKEYVKLKSTVDNEITRKKLDQYKNQLEFERFRRAQELLKFEGEQQRIYLIAVIIVLVVVTAAALFLIGANNKRKKINKILVEQNEIINANQKALEEKNSELVDLNNAKDRLFAIIAHDLKNPFFILINFSEMLKEDYNSLSDKERLNYIFHIATTANTTYQLLENLLDLSASRTGSVTYKPELIELKPVFDNILQLYSSQLHDKQINFKSRISSDLKIFADKRMMEVVFRNLINNAIKYTHKGGKVEVEYDYKNGFAEISVVDNGTGMSEETAKGLFSLTFNKSTVGTNGEKGTGIGINLCKEFIEKNGGTISVKSALGKGTTFTVKIPRNNSN